VYANGIAIDTAGNAYVTGWSFSSDFPIVNGFQAATNNSTNGNAFVARIDTTKTGSASLIYSTYLGGGGNASNQGMGDWAAGIAVDSVGRAYVTGLTTSDTSVAPFPTTASAFQSSLSNSNGNAFLTAVDTTQVGAASLVYSTYLGGDGSGPFGDFGVGVTVDSFGDAYLVGQTTSDASGPFPTTSGAYQSSLNSSNGNVFVTEIATAHSGSQSLVYSTYLGGSTSNPLGDYGSSITLDSGNKVYIVGDAASSDFPATAGAFQTANSADGKAFVAKFDLSQSGTQSLAYSTLVGGMDSSSGDDGRGIAVDGVGDAFVVGQTSSTDFPTTTDAIQSALRSSGWNAFLTEFSPDGSSLLYSTYIGGSSAFGDVAMDVALDPLGNSYIAGYTESSDFPTTASAYQTTLKGAQSAFVTMLSSPTAVASLAVNPQSPSLVSAETQQFSAIATLNNGNTQDVTAIAVWTSSSSSVIQMSNVAETEGFCVALATGSATVTATVGTVSASGSVTVVTAPSPVISSITPTSGSGGTQVTVDGSGFGSTQGRGYLWLGSTIGTIVSWTDTEIVATVAPASTSGIVQVTQGGLQSNSVTFTVAISTITSITPTSGLAATQVTINGSGFGTAQGNGQVRLGTMNGIVNSWTDTVVVATVASGSASGNVQILQHGVWSNAVGFTVPLPTITSISPTSGTSGTSVTVVGSGFGGSQGSGTVWIGGTYAAVSSWSDGTVVATVGNNAVTGVAKVEQNLTWSNAVQFVVPPTGGSGTAIILVPNVLNMAVGNTRSIQAVNSVNQPVTGLTWTSSDTTIVTLSTDNPPVLTAVAPGNATIYAGNASADVTVFAGPNLPAGTVHWSNPGDGSGVSQIIPAVPSTSGTDVFAIEKSGNVQAMRADGSVAWTTNASNNSNLYNPPFVMADFLGGTVVYTGSTIYSLDAATGQPNPAYVGTSYHDQNWGLGYPAVHTDGTIFTVESSCKPQDCPGSTDSSTGARVVGIDPATGLSKFQVPVVSGPYRGTVRGDDSLCGTPGTQSGYNLSSPNGFSIAGDGYAYTSYIELDSTSDVGEPAQTYPATAFGLFNQIAGAEWATNPSKAIADMATLAAMVPVANSIYSDFVQAEQAGDSQYAWQLLYGISARIRPYCTANNSKTYKLHVLRVGSDGSASDMVVHEWNAAFVGAFWNGNVMAGTTSFNFQQTGPDPLTGITTHPIITNADSGALLSWEVFLPAYCATASIDTGCTDNVPTSVEHHLTTTSGGGVGFDAIWNVPGVPNYEGYYWVVPSLQLQDGSYVGTASYVYPQFEMVNFDTQGNIRWSVPNFAPQIATADGGVVAQSADGSTTAIFDAGGGSATGSAPSLPSFSWKRAYQQSNSVSAVEIPSPPLLNSFQAVNGGNLTGNTTALRHQSLAVVWCSNEISGTCAGNDFPSLGNPIVDLGFEYGPWPVSIPNLYDFTEDHPEWVTQIVGFAMGSLRAAYKGLPVIIQPVSFTYPCPHSGWFSWLPCAFWPKPSRIPSIDSYDHLVYITGNVCPYNGTTSAGQSPSYVCFPEVMGDAQWAVGGYNSNQIWQPLSPTYSSNLSSTQQTQFLSIVKATGVGLGNVTAHEVGHQFSLPQMDCDRPANLAYQGPPAGPPCPGTGTHDLFYEYFSSAGTPGTGQDQYLFSGSPMTWTSQDMAYFSQVFLAH